MFLVGVPPENEKVLYNLLISTLGALGFAVVTSDNHSFIEATEMVSNELEKGIFMIYIYRISGVDGVIIEISRAHGSAYDPKTPDIRSKLVYRLGEVLKIVYIDSFKDHDEVRDILNSLPSSQDSFTSSTSGLFGTGSIPLTCSPFFSSLATSTTSTGTENKEPMKWGGNLFPLFPVSSSSFLDHFEQTPVKEIGKTNLTEALKILKEMNEQKIPLPVTLESSPLLFPLLSSSTSSLTVPSAPQDSVPSIQNEYFRSLYGTLSPSEESFVNAMHNAVPEGEDADVPFIETMLDAFRDEHDDPNSTDDDLTEFTQYAIKALVAGYKD